MTGEGALLLGIGLGLRHATDADHVVVLTTLLQREPGTLRAARIAALWSAGHTASFLAVGLLVVLSGLRVPPRFEAALELLVAAMLLGFGALHVARAGRPRKAAPPAAARPVLVGVVHGLAGSAGVALVAATTISSRLWAALYLGLFGLGTVLGMVALTVALSWPIAWTARREGAIRPWLARASGALSVALGLAMAVEAASKLAAPR